MSETESVEMQYEALPLFDISAFKKGSFFSWKYDSEPARTRFFQDAPSISAMLNQLTEYFPNLCIYRGSSFEKPLGEKGDFFVGNIWSALLYMRRDSMQQRRKNPVLVTAKLQDVMQQLREGSLELLYDLPTNHRAFVVQGTINIQCPILKEKIPDCFSVTKPPTVEIDKSLSIHFSKAVLMHNIQNLLPRRK